MAMGLEPPLKKLKTTPVSVIIPAHNEEPTVTSVVKAARGNRNIDEVIVVDDGSHDGTSGQARRAGAEVVRLEQKSGKGAAMKTGLQKSVGEIVVFIDADLKNITTNHITSLMLPVAYGYDLCKASFDRAGGRVTELTAKPLLKIFFPEIKLNQPLSGQKAAKRGLLNRVELEDDYGVDIGIVIDAAMSGARITEAYIGQLDHQSHPLWKLTGTAEQVTRTILAKAQQYDRLNRIGTLSTCPLPRM